MNTYKKYSKRIPDFFKIILDTEPDYIVPVERKGCKLLRSLHLNDSEIVSKIRYRQFFKNVKPDIRGKRVAVIDDASKYTSTLFEYRKYFEKLGADVNTYSFIGQDLLQTGEREQYDKAAHIFQFLNESTYQEYIIQQSIELSKEDNFFDVDHLVFRTKMSKERFYTFFMQIEELGKIDFTNDVYTPKVLTKLCLYDFTFPIQIPFDYSICVYDSPLQKIRFAYKEDCETLSIVPLALVSWDSKASADLANIFAANNIVPPYEFCPNLEPGGIYVNIVHACCLYLLKTFLSQISGFPELDNLKIEDYDLQAYVGVERIDLLKKSIASFLKSTINNKTYPLQCLEQSYDSLSKFRSVFGFMQQLRGEYERRLAVSRSVLNTKYFVSYYELFARYDGRASLMKWIDILCDRGVLVTRNIDNDGIYCRGCRSGEADYDHIERKTEILLPIIINACGKQDGDVYRIKATLLNKIISNLCYDYPNDTYDFHNFFRKPYLYGPLAYVKNQLNDEVEISLYDIEKISKFCKYDEGKKEFMAVAQDHIEKDIDAFSQCDMVPFTEITTYVGCLYQISVSLNKADALNELAICRDQDTYYRHVHFDLVTAYNSILAAYHNAKIPSKAERHLREAAKIANEAIKKLNYDQENLFSRIGDAVGREMLFRTAYRTILKSKIDFTDSFKKSLSALQNVAHIEKALINLMLYLNTFDKRYLGIFHKAVQPIGVVDQEKINNLDELYRASDHETYNRLFGTYYDTVKSVVQQLRVLLRERIQALPRPKDNEHALAVQRQNMELAVNRCIQYIKKNNLSQYTLLHFNYSGYRNTEGTKSVNIIESVQNTLSHLLNDLSHGQIVYGLTGELACGTVLFGRIEDAIQYAKHIRYLSNSPEFSQIIFKFGCCSRDIMSKRESLHDEIREAQENAIYCSSQKHIKAEFMITDDTYLHLEDDIRKEFAMVRPESPEAESKYYVHNDFVSADSSQVIKWPSNTDDSIEIGLITALTEEYVAMQKMLIDPKTVIFPKSEAIPKTVGREYCVGKIKSFDGNYHKVALTKTLGPGNTSAATRANSLLSRFPKINVLIMVGIAGGIPSPEDREKHVRLGDIVVAESVISYDFVSDRPGKVEPRGRNVPPCPRLCEAQNRLKLGQFLDKRPWESYIDELGSTMPTKFARPPEDTDVLYDKKGNQIPHPADPERTAYPRIFDAKIASADRVLKNPKKREQLKRDYSVCAVEMESSGIADVTWKAEIGYYVVRGICDYCDVHKNDVWHNYAALVAASYTRALIENLPY